MQNFIQKQDGTPATMTVTVIDLLDSKTMLEHINALLDDATATLSLVSDRMMDEHNNQKTTASTTQSWQTAGVLNLVNSRLYRVQDLCIDESKKLSELLKAELAKGAYDEL